MDWLQRFDLTAFKSINLGLHCDVLTTVCWVLSYSGLAVCQIVGSLCLTAFRSTRTFVIPILISMAVSGLAFADGVKSLIPRDRPSTLPFAIRQEPFLHSSFPSGHTAVSFGTATILLLLTRQTNHRWVGPVALLWASGVGFSRIYRGVHWPTDVLAGACFGVVGACLTWMIIGAIKGFKAPGVPE